MSSTPSAPSSRDSTPVAPESDFLSTLTLSNKPVLAAPPTQNPIFGMPSMASNTVSASPPRGPGRPNPRSPGMDVDMDDEEQDPDAMDVDPMSPVKKPGRNGNDDASWLRPQRFFAPEEPTGLENLFARTIRLVDTSEPTGRGNGGAPRRHVQQLRVSDVLRDWRMWAILSIIPLFAVGYQFWFVRPRTLTPMPLPI